MTGLWFDGQKYFANTLSARHEEKMLPVFGQVREWLDCYFGGGIPGFTPPVHLQGSPFRLAVWDVLRQIPYGETVTYGEIAREIARRQGVRNVSGAGRRRRRGAQSRQHRRALPPRRREQRKPDGLCGRHYAESAASESRTGGNVGIVRSEKRDRIVGGRPLSRLLV